LAASATKRSCWSGAAVSFDEVLDRNDVRVEHREALRQARPGRRGPVYLDMPADVLYEEVEKDSIVYREPGTSMSMARTNGDLDAVRAAIKLLGEVELSCGQKTQRTGKPGRYKPKLRLPNPFVAALADIQSESSLAVRTRGEVEQCSGRVS